VAQPPQDVDLGAQSREVPRGLAGLGDALDGDEGARVFSSGLVDLDGAGWSWGGGRAPVERAKKREEGEGRRREAEEVEKKEERWRGIGAKEREKGKEACLRASKAISSAATTFCARMLCKNTVLSLLDR
jgi:hypothetical protein